MIETLRPKLELLTKEMIKKIIEEAYIVIEREGVFIENKEALSLFKQAGMKVDSTSQRVHITPQLVEDSLASTPSTIKMYDREGKKEYVLGGDEVHFDPGSCAVTILDSETDAERKAVTKDLIRFARLTDCLEHLHLQSTGILSTDVPEVLADSYRMYIGLQYSKKPMVTGTFRVEGFQPMHRMLVAIRGSEKNLAEKPLAIFDACPSPPLKWSNLTAQSLIDSARAGIPSELISMGMTGATSPVTLAGTLVQHVVETLSGIVICQLAKKGSPVIFGGCPVSFDMRKGTTPIGAIETLMIDSGYVQIGKYLNLPTHTYMGMSDAKTNDPQAGFETGIGVIMAALSGANVISGAGILDFIKCQSLEKLVIDNQICGSAYRLIQGISQRDEPIALDLFKDFTADTHFLSMPHTRKWFKEEQTYPKLIDRDPYDIWVSRGRKSIVARAKEEVEELLQKNPPSLPQSEIRKELREIMLSDARSNDIPSLPEIDIS
ncbi:MAG: trimethylamine methyltransferase family protein [Candidatus Aminicenantes bacterium]|nr:trimethylamine methyltransferase family protein [Candidatus Aminicenantes bacterium]